MEMSSINNVLNYFPQVPPMMRVKWKNHFQDHLPEVVVSTESVNGFKNRLYEYFNDYDY